MQAACRRDFHAAMLALLVDCLAAGASPAHAGALLPAVASSGRGLQAHASSALAAHRTSTDALQQMLLDDAPLCKASCTPLPAPLHSLACACKVARRAFARPPLPGLNAVGLVT